MSKENLNKPQKKTAVNLAQDLIGWAKTINEWGADNVSDALHDLHYGYNCSDLADNTEERRNILFYHSLIQRFFKAMRGYGDQEFSDLSNLKIEQDVPQ